MIDLFNRVSFPWSDPFIAKHKARLAELGEGNLEWDIFDHSWKVKSPVGLDVEIARNLFLVCVQRFTDGKRLAFELSERSPAPNFAALKTILRANTIITFNGNAYDIPIICMGLLGATTADMKAASDKIISYTMRPKDIEQELGIRIPQFDHIDLIASNPSIKQSLKMLHARLHGQFIVDLPFDPAASLTSRDINLATLYCFNDLEATFELWKALKESQAHRVALGKEYDMDFRSRSDAQIGEAIVRRRVEATLGHRLAKVEPTGSTFAYTSPVFISFQSAELRRLLDYLTSIRFSAIDGNVMGFEGTDIKIGKMRYQIGIGGLHSTEMNRAVVADDEHFLEDIDVASQYPNIISILGLYPAAMGPTFLDIYRKLIKERLEAKRLGRKNEADGLRIALNGTYGKLGSVYSPLYAPHAMIAVTLTGQLSLLMLIERCEAAGLEVVSANTDGLVIKALRSKKHIFDETVAAWEQQTGFVVERTPYRAIYNSSVNTYIAIKEDGKVKRKGAISDPWSEGDLRGQLMKNPQMTVCSEAVVRLVTDGIPLRDTIRDCRDPRMFITVIKVTGGAVWRGHRLGRVVRYYWSVDGDPIMYADGKRRVSKTEGARPMVELLTEMPPDLDHERYFYEARKLAKDLGVEV